MQYIMQLQIILTRTIVNALQYAAVEEPLRGHLLPQELLSARGTSMYVYMYVCNSCICILWHICMYVCM